MDKIARIEQELQSFCDQQREYYQSEDNMNNYSSFPMEENYMHAVIYSNVEIASWVEKYGYNTIEDLFHDLYANCDIEAKWNNGYYYKPINKISFGYYRIDEVEIEIPEEIANRILSLSLEDRNAINTDICIDFNSTKYGNLSGYTYMCGGISFELPIEAAEEWMKDNRKLVMNIDACLDYIANSFSDHFGIGIDVKGQIIYRYNNRLSILWFLSNYICSGRIIEIYECDTNGERS